MFLKFWLYFHNIIENLEFAILAAFAKALLQPLETRAKTIVTVLSTAILGTLIGASASHISFLKDFAFGISTVIGLFGREVFDFCIDFIRDKDKFSSLFKK